MKEEGSVEGKKGIGEKKEKEFECHCCFLMFFFFFFFFFYGIEFWHVLSMTDPVG